MSELYRPVLAPLPLLLWKTPPGLELILAQEGIAYEVVRDPHPFGVPAGPVRALRRPAESAARLRACSPTSTSPSTSTRSAGTSRSTRSRRCRPSRRARRSGSTGGGALTSGCRASPRRGSAAG